MEDRIKELYDQGYDIHKTCEVLNVSAATVYRGWRKHNLKPRKRQWGLEGDIVSKVIDAYRAGESGPSISKRLGCNPSTVTRILSREKVKARPHSEYDIDENFFDVIDTEEKAYCLGFITADGCVTRGGVLMVRVADLDVIEKIKTAMGHTAPVRVIEPRKFHHKTLYALEVGRKKLADDLAKWGCPPNKTFLTAFPSTIPPEMYVHFIRGLFDGDGSLYMNKNGQWGFKILGTVALLGPILRIIRDQTNAGGGIYPCINIFYIGISGKFQIKRVLDWMYKDCTIRMDRKYKLYQELTNGLPTRDDHPEPCL